MRNQSFFKSTFYLFLILASISACRDDINDLIVEIDEEPFTVFIESTIRGQVVDESGSTLSNAFVQINGRETSSDADGNFELTNVEVKKTGGGVVTASVNGYFEGVSHSNFSADGTSFVEIRLLEKGTPDVINSTSEQTINKTNGLKMMFPQNGILSSDGEIHNGPVNVFSRWIDPTDENLGGIMPGALNAVDGNGDEKVLATYGMLVLELETVSGEKLEVNPNVELTAEIPIPDELLSEAPDEMPLWEYDLEEGQWLEKGVCKKSGSSYVCNIPATGIWNCDIPLEAICLSSQVFNTDLSFGSFLKVVVEDLTDNFIYWGYTDMSGFFCGSVPQAAPLRITIVDHCDNVVHMAEIGPFSEDFQLEDTILDDNVSEFQINVMGVLAHCQTPAALVGHLGVRYPGTLEIFPVSADGSFNVDIALKCTDFPSIELTVYNGIELGISTTTVVNMDSDVNLGVQTTCENIDDFFMVMIDGVGFITSPTQYYLRPNQTADWLVLEGLSVSGAFTLELRDYQGPGEYTTNTFFKTENNSTGLNYPNLDIVSPDIVVNVTEDDGEFITGNYSGVTIDADNNTIDFSGDFVIKRAP